MGFMANCRGDPRDLKRRYLQDSFKYIVILLWVVGNITTFTVTFRRYTTNQGPGQAFECPMSVMGVTLAVARGAAATLDLNCALILLPVCRNLLSLLRGSVRSPVFRRFLDKNLTFHKALAWAIMAGTFAHVGAHTINFRNAAETTNTDCGFAPGTQPEHYLYTTIAGLTGIALVVIMFFMYSSSVEVMRRNYFEVFWFTHHLFCVFFLLLCFHGTGGIVMKRQPDGTYKSQPPVFWMYVVVPLGIYLIERGIRYYRSKQHTVVHKVIQHPSQVVELQIKKKNFCAAPGQYVFVHCPEISPFEWHPFTLTSAPEEDFLSVHIRVAGDWTGALAERLGCKWGRGKGGASQPVDIVSTDKLPRVAVDGPFGTSSEDVWEFENVVLVGAGIGVTPFASILKSIWYRLNNPRFRLRTKRVHFFWICRDKEAFEWFAEVLDALEVQLEELGRSDLLDANVYLTGSLNASEVRGIMFSDQTHADAITGLRAKTQFGRPNWDAIFANLAREHDKQQVGVFFCGPKVLSSELHSLSLRHTDPRPGGTQFVFNKENF